MLLSHGSEQTLRAVKAIDVFPGLD